MWGCRQTVIISLNKHRYTPTRNVHKPATLFATRAKLELVSRFLKIKAPTDWYNISQEALLFCKCDFIYIRI